MPLPERIIDVDETIDLLNKTAENYGDFIYRQTFDLCNYALNPLDETVRARNAKGEIAVGIPLDNHCIVGRVLSYLGISDDTLEHAFTGLGIDALNAELMSHDREFDFAFTEPAVRVLSKCQAWQDGTDNVPWRDVIKLAEAGIGADSDTYMDKATVLLGYKPNPKPS